MENTLSNLHGKHRLLTNKIQEKGKEIEIPGGLLPENIQNFILQYAKNHDDQKKIEQPSTKYLDVDLDEIEGVE